MEQENTPDSGLELGPENEVEEVKQYPSRVIFDGNCPNGEHQYVERYTDKDGLVNVLCSHCPMGSMFDPKTYRLLGGKVIRKK